MLRSSRFLSVALVAWFSLIAAGFTLAWRYETKPGKAAVRKDWPAASRLSLDRTRPNIVLFAHPACPCTRASLEELSELAQRYPGRASWTVVMVGAPGLDQSLSNSENARLARSIPGANVVADPNGAEARRFGAATSGQTFAFRPDGIVAFRGGVTSVRGHFGPSRGLECLEELLQARPLTHASAPVYGCSLSESNP